MNLAYNFTTAPLSGFNPRPEYDLSLGRDLAPLMESINDMGQITPILAKYEISGQLVIINGYRRFLALKALKAAEALVAIVPNDYPNIFKLSLMNNQARGFNLAEKALIIKHFNQEPGFSLEELSRILNEPLGPKNLQAYQLAADWPRKYLEALAGEQLDLNTLKQLSPYPEADKFKVADIFLALGLSQQKRKLVIELIEDIARRENISLAQVAQGPEITEALAVMAKAGRPQAGEAARQGLWQRRNPQLAALTKKREQLIKNFYLKPQLALNLDPVFEDNQIKITLAFDNIEVLKKQIASLEKLAANPDLSELLTGF